MIEEARHIRFAREELDRQVAAADPIGLAYSRLVIARAAYAVATRLVHPSVYRAVGIDPVAGRRAARGNPHFQATLRWSASRITARLLDLGLIAGPTRLLWQRANLL